MPAAKKKKRTAPKKKAALVKETKMLEVKVSHLSDQMNALLVVFAIGMMLLAYVLYKTYAV